MSGAGRAILRTKRRSKGLVGEWIGQTYESTNLPDHSGNGNTGTIYGASWVAGRVAPYRALSFDGSDDYVGCGNGASLDITGAITVGVWVYILGNASAVRAGIVGKAGANEVTGWVVAQQSEALNDIRLYYSNTSFLIGTITRDKWYYLVFVYNGTNITPYIDGVPGTSGAASAFTSTTNSLEIGRNSGRTGSRINGIVSGVRIWNRALSAREVLDHYHNQRRRFVWI